MVECLPNMLEALGVIPNTPYKTNRTEQRRKEEEEEENYYWGKLFFIVFLDTGLLVTTAVCVVRLQSLLTCLCLHICLRQRPGLS